VGRVTMATEIGVIKTLVGTAVATAADGSQRTLQAGDRVFQNEVITTDDAGAVEIEFSDGSSMTLGRGSETALDLDAFNPQAVAQIPSDDSNVEALQQALLEGADPSQIGDATAAGAGTGSGGNEGTDFVQILHESSEVTPESGFETTGITVAFEDEREADFFDGTPTAGITTVLLDEDDLYDFRNGRSEEDHEALKAAFDDIKSAFESAEELSAHPHKANGPGLNDEQEGDDLPPDAKVFVSSLLNVDFGADGPGDIVFNAEGTQPAGLTSGGEDIQYWVSADGHSLVAYIDFEHGRGRGQGEDSGEDGGQESHAHIIFTAEITDVITGEFQVMLLGPVDHPDGTTEDNLFVNLGFTISDLDGDTAAGVLRLDIDDDSPVIVNNYYKGGEGNDQGEDFIFYGKGGEDLAADEDDIDGRGNQDNAPGDDYSNTYQYLSLDFGADGPAETDPVALSPEGIVDQYGNALTSNGVELQYTWDGDSDTLIGYTDDVNSPVLTISVNYVYQYGADISINLLDNLDHPQNNYEDNLEFDITYTVTDFDGDSVSSTFGVDIDDDMPVIVPQRNVVDEEGLPTGNAGDSYDEGQGITVFENTNDVAIPHGEDQVTSTIDVSGLSSIADLNVLINLNHTWDSDLNIFLISPNGTRIELSTGNGASGDNYTNTLFDDEASTEITSGTAPFTGSFRPEGNLSDLDGENPNGTWTLEINDQFPSSADGLLFNWALQIDTGAGDVAGEALTAQGSLGISWGADDNDNDIAGAATAPADRNVSFDVQTAPAELTSNGVPVVYSVSDDGLTLTATVGETVVFTVVITDEGTGTYDFTLLDNLDHLGDDSVDTEDDINLIFDFTATDSDGDAVGSHFTITVDDDGPVIGEPVDSIVDEEGLATGNAGDSYQPATEVTVFENTDDVDIPNIGTITSTIDVSGLTSIADLNVLINLDHTWTGDLDIFLISPNGTRVELSTDNWGLGKGADYTNTLFDDEAATGITAGSPPFTGSFRPEGDLSALDGENPNGTWTLEITDDALGDWGTLFNWELQIESGPDDVVGEALTAHGDLAISWGSDDNNTGDANRSVTFDAQSAPDGLKSNGNDITYVVSSDGTTLLGLAGSTIVFSVTLSDLESGSYDFTLYENLDHPTANTEDDLNLTFNFTATDSDGDTTSSSFTVTVDDDAPVFVTDSESLIVDEDGLTGASVDAGRTGEVTGTNSATATGNLADNFKFGADEENASIFSINGVEAAATGTITIETAQYRIEVTASTGTYTFTLLDNVLEAGAGENLQSIPAIDLTVIAQDGDGDQISGDITLNVSVLDDIPVVTADTNSNDAVVEDTDATAAGNVLTNDTGADGSVVTTTAKMTGTYGSVTIDADGEYIYELNNDAANVQALTQDEVVIDAFNYSVVDGDGDTAQSTLTFTITGTNDAPTAVGDNVFNHYVELINDLESYITIEDSFGINVGGKDNFSVSLSIEPVATPSQGDNIFHKDGAFSLAIGAGGHLMFKMATEDLGSGLNLDGSIPIPVQIHSWTELHQTSLSLDVNAVNDITFSYDGVNVTITNTNESGVTTTFVMSYTGTVVDPRNPLVLGSTYFEAKVDDLVVSIEGREAFGDFILDFESGVESTFTLGSDAYIVEEPINEDTPLLIDVAKLLANDSDPEGDAFNIVSVQGGVNGTAVLSVDKSTVTFTPDPDYFGNASFTYTIEDPHGAAATATVDFYINSVNDAPVAQGETITKIAEDGFITVSPYRSETFSYIDELSDDFNSMAAPLSDTGHASGYGGVTETVTTGTDGSRTSVTSYQVATSVTDSSYYYEVVSPSPGDSSILWGALSEDLEVFEVIEHVDPDFEVGGNDEFIDSMGYYNEGIKYFFGHNLTNALVRFGGESSYSTVDGDDVVEVRAYSNNNDTTYIIGTFDAANQTVTVGQDGFEFNRIVVFAKDPTSHTTTEFKVAGISGTYAESRSLNDFVVNKSVLLANDTDVDDPNGLILKLGDGILYDASNTAIGTVSIDAQGNIFIAPAPGFDAGVGHNPAVNAGIDIHFSYSVVDSDGVESASVNAVVNVKLGTYIDGTGSSYTQSFAETTVLEELPDGTGWSVITTPVDALLIGTDGNDHLFGNNGDDQITGGKGNDLLQGDSNLSTSADTFIWNREDMGVNGSPAHDTVLDFDTSEGDELNLSDLLSDGSHTIEGVDNGSGDLQLNIKSGGNTVQEIELSGVSAGSDAAAALQSLLASGAIDDGI
jgi:T1SS-143 domain-containing protein